ncbi:hypothetical protein M5689_005924 [Euphorbia peplus]|nr:hypothetical protein M5689_005924 [Euphorbia peplus]
MEKFMLCYSLIILCLILYPNLGCLAARELLDGRSGKGENQSRVHGSEPSPDGSAKGQTTPRSSTSGNPFGSQARTCSQYNRCRNGSGTTTRTDAPKYDYNTVHGKPKDRYKYHIPPRDTNN